MNGTDLSRWLVLGVLLSKAVAAYEITTHALLTEQAYQRSALAHDDELQKGLGLVDAVSKKDPFGSNYLEFRLGGDLPWATDAFEAEVFDDMNPSRVGDSLRVSGWLMRGAIREDDYKSGWKYGICYLPKTDQPDDYETIMDRPLNHFFDPINDQGTPLGDKAPDWGTGAMSAYNAPLVKDNDGSDNHFSIFQAREAEYRALTGLDTDGNLVASDPTTRNKYWATLFRSLGDLVHLIQDMAQPQHTRNDPHSGACYDGGVFSGHKSVYEQYIEAAVIGETYTFEYLTEPQVYGQLPPLNTYPIPRYDDYASYFSTRHLDAAGVRRGLADYSNYGFFSSGTNMNGKYNAPSDNAANYTAMTVPTGGLSPDYTMTELHGTVPDIQQPGATAAGVPLTTESLWSEALAAIGAGGTEYTLTRSNYDAMAAQLLPRAVAYSAGILNYFFRGRLELQVDAFSSNVVSVKLRNSTFNETLYGERHDGSGTSIPASLMLIYEYTDAQGQVQTGFADSRVAMDSSVTVPFGEWGTTSYSFQFNGQPIPADVSELRFRLVFRGRLGNEYDAIAVGYLDATSPGFIFTPSARPSDGINGSRWMHKTQGTWRLDTELTGLQGGNIDWKGRYVNGTPGAVLSYSGPTSRSLPHLFWGTTPFGANIFKDGELYAVAPLPVLGAALRQDDADGEDWIIAICQQDDVDIIYKRPNVKDVSSALYDPNTSPMGWREVDRIDRQGQVESYGYLSMSADQPWFFNGNGSEAQTMWFVRVPGAGSLGVDLYHRVGLKLSLTDTSMTPTFRDKDISPDKTLIALDYDDSMELRLEIDANDWLTVNGKPLMNDPELLDVEDFNGEEETLVTYNFIENTSFSIDGLNSAAYNKAVTTGVYVNVHYIDMRHTLLGMTVSEYIGSHAYKTSGKRYLLKSGIPKAMDDWSGGNPYVPEAMYGMTIGTTSLRYGDYYLFYGYFNDGMAKPSNPNCASARDDSTFCSTTANYGVLNYLEGGNPDSVLGVPANTEIQNISVK